MKQVLHLKKMAYRIMNNINELFDTWKPRERYELIKIEAKKPKFAPHKLEY